jgi:hypothetical protein
MCWRGYTQVYSCFKNSLIIYEENTKKNRKRVASLYVIKGIPSGFPCRIARSMREGCRETFGKRKNTRAAGECIFPLSESRATSQVHGSRYPAWKTIWYSFYKITTVKQWHFENPAKILRRPIKLRANHIDQSNCVSHCSYYIKRFPLIYINFNFDFLDLHNVFFENNFANKLTRSIVFEAI